MNYMTDRILPQSVEFEDGILSSCLCDASSVDEIVSELKPDYFYRTANAIIFDAISVLFGAGDPIDVTVLMTKLSQDGNLEKIGGATRLGAIMNIPIPSSVAYYIKKIKDTYLLRETIRRANEISTACFDGGDASEIIDDAQKKIMSIHIDGGLRCSKFSELTERASDRYEELYKNRGKISGVPTGFQMLDHYTCGFQNSSLIVIAARPSMGKSSLVGNIAISASEAGIAVGGFSLEMTKDEWLDRAVSGYARVNSNKFRSGYFQPNDWDKILNAVERIHSLPIVIDDDGDLDHRAIRNRARKMKKKFGCQMFFIDHLQLVTGEKSDRKDLEVGSITRAFKMMAKELECPVILLSQLNRGLESRNDKRPKLSDLRESGAIEQDADIVLFIYRRSVYDDWDGFKHGQNYYHKRPGPDENIDPGLLAAFNGDSELIVAKQRNGPTGGMKLFWQGKFTMFSELTPSDRSMA